MVNSEKNEKPSGKRTLIMTLVAAVGTAVVNNLYWVIYTSVTGVSIPQIINFASVTTFSVAPVLLGGIIYWVVARFNTRVANIGLLVGTIALFIAFSIPSFGDTIMTPAGGTIPAPDGFAGLSFGLHFAGPILLLSLVPAWRGRILERK